MKNQVQKSTGIFKVLSTKIAANAARAILFLAFFLIIAVGESYGTNYCVSATSISSSTATLCGTGSITLTNTITRYSDAFSNQNYTVEFFVNSTNSTSGGTQIGSSQNTNAGTLTTTQSVNYSSYHGTTKYFYSTVTTTNVPGACSSSAYTSGTVQVIFDNFSILYNHDSKELDCINYGPTIKDSITVNGSPTSYQWFYNLTNSTSGGTSAITHTSSNTFDTLLPTIATVSDYYYYVVATDVNGCKVSVVSGEVEIVDTYSWNDNQTTTNWFDDGNWCGGAPTTTYNAIINPDDDFIQAQPIINNTGAVTEDLTLNGINGSGNIANLTVSTGYNLTIDGNLINNGAFVTNMIPNND